MKTLVGNPEDPRRKPNSYGSYSPKQRPTPSDGTKKSRSNNFYMSMSSTKNPNTNWEHK